MPKNEVKIELSHGQEIALQDRFGRRHSREGLVKKALAEVFRLQAEDIPVFVSVKEWEALAESREEPKRDTPERRLIARFASGIEFVDNEGRRVSNLALLDSGPGRIDGGEDEDQLVVQVEGDDSEWTMIRPDELLEKGLPEDPENLRALAVEDDAHA